MSSQFDACRAVGLSRAAWYPSAASWREREADVIAALTARIDAHPRWGAALPRSAVAAGPRWNPNRVRRVYRAPGPNRPRRPTRRVPHRPREPLVAPSAVNRVWALDFMPDALYGGRRFRTFDVLDETNREGPRPRGRDVHPREPRRAHPRSAHGSVWAARRRPARKTGRTSSRRPSRLGCRTNRVEARFIQPGKPDQHAFIARFHRTYREEMLDAYVFDAITVVQQRLRSSPASLRSHAAPRRATGSTCRWHRSRRPSRRSTRSCPWRTIGFVSSPDGAFAHRVSQSSSRIRLTAPRDHC